MDGGSISLNDNMMQLAGVGDSLSETVNKLQETAVASGAVIGHRMNIAFAAAANPAGADHAEFHLMTSEKIEGFSASASATMGGLFGIQASLMQIAFGHATRTTAAMVEAVLASSPIRVADVHQRWIEDSFEVAQVHSWDLANKLADLSTLALDPLHSRATDNAKRLADGIKFTGKPAKG